MHPAANNHVIPRRGEAPDVVTEGNPFRGNLNKNLFFIDFDEIATLA